MKPPKAFRTGQWGRDNIRNLLHASVEDDQWGAFVLFAKADCRDLAGAKKFHAGLGRAIRWMESWKSGEEA